MFAVNDFIAVLNALAGFVTAIAKLIRAIRRPP